MCLVSLVEAVESLNFASGLIMLSTAGGDTALLLHKGDMCWNAWAFIDYRQQCVTMVSAAPCACGLKTSHPTVDRQSDSTHTSPPA